jgi:hypothetical protein
VNGAFSFVNGAFSPVNGAFSFVNGAFSPVNGESRSVQGICQWLDVIFKCRSAGGGGIVFFTRISSKNAVLGEKNPACPSNRRFTPAGF